MKPAGAKRWLALALLAIALAQLASGSFNRYYLGVSIDIAIGVVLAASLNLINGHTGQFSLGHCGFMAVGAYVSGMLTLAAQRAGAPPALGPAVFGGALVAGGLVAALAGVAVGIPSFRLRGDYLAIVTLGFGEIIRVFFQTFEPAGAASGLKGIPFHTNFLWAWGAAAVTIYVVGSLVNSTYGRGFLAVHDDEIAAGAMGVNPTRYKITAFAIGSFFAGIAGGIYAHYKGFLNPSSFDFMKSIEVVVMVILGGMGRTAGVVVAAILLTVISESLRSHPGLDAYRMILYSLVIIVLMLVRPQGLFSFVGGRRAQGK
jgi:branched-chain amino acid transport system permease protein